jgi:hypothetical protein
MNTLIQISVASLIGSNIVSRISNGFVQSSINLFFFMKEGTNSAEIIKHTLQKIDELDLDVKIKILKSYLQSNENRNVITEGVDEIIEKSQHLLDKIKNEISCYETKWLGRYRVFDVSEDLLELNKFNNILKNRIEMLSIK